MSKLWSNAVSYNGSAITCSDRVQFLERYLAEQPNEGNALSRLFGANVDYQKNFKAVLERRIAQLGGLDATLKRKS